MRRWAVERSFLLLLAAAIGLTGCASVEQTVDDQIDASVAAVGTARLAVEQLVEGRSYGPTVDTALLDALTQLEDAERSLAEVVPASDSQFSERQTALSGVHDAIMAVAAARWSVADGAALAGVRDELERIRQQLETGVRERR